jgi:hypothetical protein
MVVHGVIAKEVALNLDMDPRDTPFFCAVMVLTSRNPLVIRF